MTPEEIVRGCDLLAYRAAPPGSISVERLAILLTKDEMRAMHGYMDNMTYKPGSTHATVCATVTPRSIRLYGIKLIEDPETEKDESAKILKQLCDSGWGIEICPPQTGAGIKLTACKDLSRLSLQGARHETFVKMKALCDSIEAMSK